MTAKHQLERRDVVAADAEARVRQVEGRGQEPRLVPDALVVDAGWHRGDHQPGVEVPWAEVALRELDGVVDARGQVDVRRRLGRRATPAQIVMPSVVPQPRVPYAARYALPIR